MRPSRLFLQTLAFSAAILMAASARAQNQAGPGPNNAADAPNAANLPSNGNLRARANVIGTHQIDRFEAIRQLQEGLRAKPDNAADWVILGELAHEAALDLPAEQADQYFKMSTDAYEKALRLDPNNSSIQAALQFAKDQQADEAQFEQRRKQAAATYLDARRREMSRTGLSPTVQIYATPSFNQGTAAGATGSDAAVLQGTAGAGRATAGTPAPKGAANPNANNIDPNLSNINPDAGPSPLTTVTPTAAPLYQYPWPTYQPYLFNGTPYTYRQFANTYYAGPFNPTTPPTTLQQYSQQLSSGLMNSAIRRATGAPR